MKITVLLSSYNGERYIEEQLDSIISQSLDNVSILVRDDGSTDNTVKILEKYEEKGLIRWYGGENIGCAKSFWNLICNCEESDYYAFCDQDDVWDNDKLETAVSFLEKENNEQPLLYFSDVRVTDEKLGIISDNMVEVMPISYAHSLIKNISPGCTYVFNNHARDLYRMYDCDLFDIDLHDWNAYRIAACFGKVIFDQHTHMNYRQHADNVIGAERKGLGTLINAIGRFFNKKMCNSREHSAQQLEKCYGSIMSGDNLLLTRLIAHYRENAEAKRQLLKCRKFRFKGIKYLYFKFLVLINKL